MVTWTRDTAWRQGSLIERTDLQALDVPIGDAPAFALVISHDCDVANDNMALEPDVEVVLLAPLSVADRSLTHGKNPRCLHFSVVDDAGGENLFEAKAGSKYRLDKKRLAHHEPYTDYTVDTRTLDLLQRWLACRYKRHALPNSLVARGGRFLQLIQKRVKKEADSIVGIWVSFDPDGEVDEETPYELNVYFVYSVDDPAAHHAAVAVAESVKEGAEQHAGEEGYSAIYLEQCEAVSEQAFTLWDMRHTVELKLEYLSYRGDSPGPMAP